MQPLLHKSYSAHCTTVCVTTILAVYCMSIHLAVSNNLLTKYHHIYIQCPEIGMVKCVAQALVVGNFVTNLVFHCQLVKLYPSTVFIMVDLLLKGADSFYAKMFLGSSLSNLSSVIVLCYTISEIVVE